MAKAPLVKYATVQKKRKGGMPASGPVEWDDEKVGRIIDAAIREGLNPSEEERFAQYILSLRNSYHADQKYDPRNASLLIKAFRNTTLLTNDMYGTAFQSKAANVYVGHHGKIIIEDEFVRFQPLIRSELKEKYSGENAPYPVPKEDYEDFTMVDAFQMALMVILDDNSKKPTINEFEGSPRVRWMLEKAFVMANIELLPPKERRRYTGAPNGIEKAAMQLSGIKGMSAEEVNAAFESVIGKAQKSVKPKKSWAPALFAGSLVPNFADPDGLLKAESNKALPLKNNASAIAAEALAVEMSKLGSQPLALTKEEEAAEREKAYTQNLSMDPTQVIWEAANGPNDINKDFIENLEAHFSQNGDIESLKQFDGNTLPDFGRQEGTNGVNTNLIDDIFNDGILPENECASLARRARVSSILENGGQTLEESYEPILLPPPEDAAEPEAAASVKEAVPEEIEPAASIETVAEEIAAVESEEPPYIPPAEEKTAEAPAQINAAELEAQRLVKFVRNTICSYPDTFRYQPVEFLEGLISSWPGRENMDNKALCEVIAQKMQKDDLVTLGRNENGKLAFANIASFNPQGATYDLVAEGILSHSQIWINHGTTSVAVKLQEMGVPSDIASFTAEGILEKMQRQGLVKLQGAEKNMIVIADKILDVPAVRSAFKAAVDSHSTPAPVAANTVQRSEIDTDAAAMAAIEKGQKVSLPKGDFQKALHSTAEIIERVKPARDVLDVSRQASNDPHAPELVAAQ